MNDKQKTDRALQRQRQQDAPDAASSNLSDLAPLADKWIESQKHISDNQVEIARLQHQTQQHRDDKITQDR